MLWSVLSLLVFPLLILISLLLVVTLESGRKDWGLGGKSSSPIFNLTGAVLLPCTMLLTLMPLKGQAFKYWLSH